MKEVKITKEVNYTIEDEEYNVEFKEFTMKYEDNIDVVVKDYKKYLRSMKGLKERDYPIEDWLWNGEMLDINVDFNKYVSVTPYDEDASRLAYKFYVQYVTNKLDSKE